MPLLSFGTQPTKNSTTVVTLDKATLLGLSEISSDAFWSVGTNIKKAVIHYRSGIGRQDKMLAFDFTLPSPTALLSFTDKCRDDFVVQKIILEDFDGGSLVVDKAEMAAGTLSALSSASLNFAGPTYDALVLANSPLVYYRLNDPALSATAADSSGNNYSGDSSGLSFNQTGKVGTCAYFDAGTKVISLNEFGSYSGPFSMEAWFKSSGVEGAIMSWQASLAYNAVPACIYMNIYGGIQADFVTSNFETLSSGPMLNYGDNQWHHVVLTIGNSGCKLYIDGSVVNSLPNAALMNTSTGANKAVIGYVYPHALGGPSQLTNTSITAYIDEAAFYNSELSSADVLAHYNSGLSSY